MARHAPSDLTVPGSVYEGTNEWLRCFRGGDDSYLEHTLFLGRPTDIIGITASIESATMAVYPVAPALATDNRRKFADYDYTFVPQFEGQLAFEWWDDMRRETQSLRLPHDFLIRIIWNRLTTSPRSKEWATLYPCDRSDLPTLQSEFMAAFSDTEAPVMDQIHDQLREFTTRSPTEEPSTTVARFKKIFARSGEPETSARFTHFLPSTLLQPTPGVMNTFDTFSRCNGQIPRAIPTAAYCERVLLILPKHGSTMTEKTRHSITPRCTYHPQTSADSTGECEDRPLQPPTPSRNDRP